jgi:hypothetical protein
MTGTQKLSLLTASELGPVGQIERFSPQGYINHPWATSARRYVAEVDGGS